MLNQVLGPSARRCGGVDMVPAGRICAAAGSGRRPSGPVRAGPDVQAGMDGHGYVASPPPASSWWRCRSRVLARRRVAPGVHCGRPLRDGSAGPRRPGSLAHEEARGPVASALRATGEPSVLASVRPRIVAITGSYGKTTTKGLRCPPGCRQHSLWSPARPVSTTRRGWPGP